MATNTPGQAFQNKTRVAILAELDKEKRRLLQSQSMNNPGASISLSRPNLKDFRDNAEQQHIAAQQKAALQCCVVRGRQTSSDQSVDLSAGGNPPEQEVQTKTRLAILAELQDEKRRLRQNLSVNNPGASVSLCRSNLKDFRDNEGQRHIDIQQKAALQDAHAHSTGFFITQDSLFGNLILPVLPRLDPES